MNRDTGIRTAIIYNPSATDQVVSIFNQGAFVANYTARPRALLVVTPGYTNYPVINIEPGAVISWPTLSGNTYVLQSSSDNSNWTNVGGILSGTGSTNSLFIANSTSKGFFRVLEFTTPLISGSSVVSNGGFELVSGTNATGWTLSGSQLPSLTTNAAHAGLRSMQLAVTNAGSNPNTATLSQTLTNGSIIASQSYNFAFWAQQISSGVSYVQNYRMSWLGSSGNTLGTVGWSGISAVYGTWTQNVATNVTAPAGTVTAKIEISVTTGAVLNGYGAVLVDDVYLAVNTPGGTNVLAPTVQLAVQLGWRSIAGMNYNVNWTDNLAGNSWSSLVSSIPGNGITNFVSDVICSNTARYYRVVQQP